MVQGLDSLALVVTSVKKQFEELLAKNAKVAETNKQQLQMIADLQAKIKALEKEQEEDKEQVQVTAEWCWAEYKKCQAEGDTKGNRKNSVGC